MKTRSAHPGPDSDNSSERTTHEHGQPVPIVKPPTPAPQPATPADVPIAPGTKPSIASLDGKPVETHVVTAAEDQDRPRGKFDSARPLDADGRNAPHTGVMPTPVSPAQAARFREEAGMRPLSRRIANAVAPSAPFSATITPNR